MASAFGGAGGFWEPWEIVDPFDMMMRRFWNEEFPSEFEPRRGLMSVGGEPGSQQQILGGPGAPTTTALTTQQAGAPFRRPRRNPIRMDMIESPESVTIIAEMPGFNKEDIRVNVDENNIMEVSAERREERTQQPGETVPHRELHYGWYKRLFRLPTYADPENVQTEFNNGMLGIKFGRRAVPGHRQIAIQ
jgi:HSP20 family protein